MATDPSIPLQVRSYDYGGMIERNQQADLRRAQIEEARAQNEERKATKDALGKLFSGGDSVGGAMSRSNPQAMGALAHANPEMFMKVQQYFSGMDEDTRKREAVKYKAAAPVLVRMRQMPYESRRAFLQSAAPALMGNGWSQQELSQFDPTDQYVDAISAAAMTVGEVVDSQKIDWHQIGENGSFATDQMGNPTGSGNPFAPGAQHPGSGAAPPPSGGLNGVFQSLIQQESGGQPGIRGQQTAYGVPLGRTQLLPKTAQEMAGKLGVPWQPELLTGTSPQASAYQDQLGRAYFDEGLAKYGGNIEQALRYYHGGPDEAKWGPKTRTYAKAVIARARKANNPDDVRAKAQAAIQAGADPEAVRQRAAALGVTL